MRPMRPLRKMRTMRTILMALAMALVAGPALAGGTKLKQSLVPVEQTCGNTAQCNSGSCSNTGFSCATNGDCFTCSLSYTVHCLADADCNVGVPSPKSSVQLTGEGQAKISVKGVHDAAGLPLTTDGTIDTADDFILFVFIAVPSGPSSGFSVKLDFKNGSAKAAVDFSGVLPPAGSPFVAEVALATPPLDPPACPGTNSAADITARGNNSGCATGKLIGLGGIKAGS